jgi:hypothetical protein
MRRLSESFVATRTSSEDGAEGTPVESEIESVLQPSELHERARTVIGVVCAPASPSSVLLTLPIVDALILIRFEAKDKLKPTTSLPPASRTLTASVGKTASLF